MTLANRIARIEGRRVVLRLFFVPVMPEQTKADALNEEIRRRGLQPDTVTRLSLRPIYFYDEF